MIPPFAASHIATVQLAVVHIAVVRVAVVHVAVVRGVAAPALTAVGPLVRTVGVSLTPNAGQLPGASQLQTLTNGIGGWALILALVGLVVGAGIWALGAHSQNYQQSFVGRRAVLVSGLAALLIGAAPAVINFFFSTGHAVQP